MEQKILDSISVQTFNSEQELCNHLKSVSVSPLDKSPKWLFRGQVSRRPRRKWPPVPEPPLAKHAFELEQLLPTDYRKLEERLEAGESRAGLDPIYGDDIAQIRSLTTTYLMQCHSCWGDKEVQKWYDALTAAPRTETDRADNLLSIGQHYGMRMHLLDLTADWQVALWFASHDWTTGSYIPGGDGVIYQFGVNELCDAEKASNTALNRTAPKDTIRHVDIRDTPASLAPRALAQRGFSLIDAECPFFVQEMIQGKAIEVLLFPRARQPSPDNSLTKDLITPPLDQMAVLFDECKTGKLWSDVTMWLGQPGYSITATALDHQHLFG